MNLIDLAPKQEFIFKVSEEPIKLDLRRGLAEVYGTELLANKTYTFPRGSKASVFTYHGATIEITGTPLKSLVNKNCDHMVNDHSISYLGIHRDLEEMRDEAERLSERMNFSLDKSSKEATNNNPQGSQAQQQAAIGDNQQTTPDGTVDASTTTNQDHCDSNKGLNDTLPDLSKTPICIVCEQLDTRNTGKSTICRILLNYATRRGRAPIFVDLDPDQGHIGLPGTIGALSIESPIDIELGLQLRSSMLLHFGHTSPSGGDDGKSVLYYKAILDNMAKIVHSKLEQDRKSYYSGVIINTSSWTDDGDYKVLLEACKSFRANMVLVVDDVSLQFDLQKDLSERPAPVRVLNVPKTVEIYKPRATEHVELRYSKIKEYFYGTEQESFNPMTSEMKFSFLKRLIYRISNPLVLSDSLMPLGRKPQDSQVKVSPFECNASDLLHHILAVSYAQLEDVEEHPERVLGTNIMGFICVTSVRSDGEIVSILTPQKLPNPLNHVLLYSEVQYMDSLI